MNREEIAKKIKQLLSDQLGLSIEEIKEESNLMADYNADSLDAVEIIMETEDLFAMKIEDTEADKVTTVKSLIDLVERELEEE